MDQRLPLRKLTSQLEVFLYEGLFFLKAFATVEVILYALPILQP